MGAIGQLLLGALLATVLCGSRCTGGKHVNGEDFRSLTGHTATSPTFETNFGSGTQNATSSLDGQSGLPSVSPSGLPFYDLVIGVLAVGGESQKAQDEIAIIRRAYDRYNGSQVVMKSTSPVTIRVVIVVGRAGLPDETQIPANGLLLGDFFHVDVQEGYTHIAGKTKAMMALSEHLSFRFLAKTDSDAYPCLSVIMERLLMVETDAQPRVYAGFETMCGTVYPPGHKWYDQEFDKATGGILKCHPRYHQGAFYILGEALVRHLNNSRDLLTVMSCEDAMVGTWLLGINKVVVRLSGDLHGCKCSKKGSWILGFYHDCKATHEIESCLLNVGAC